MHTTLRGRGLAYLPIMVSLTLSLPSAPKEMPLRFPQLCNQPRDGIGSMLYIFARISILDMNIFPSMETDLFRASVNHTNNALPRYIQ